MCTLFLSYQSHPDYPFMLITNRDEFHERATTAAHWWPEHDDDVGLLAGRDGQLGGTWLGVTRMGRFSAVTNFRDGLRGDRRDAASRGQLVRDSLLARYGFDNEAKINWLRSVADDYLGFNLLFGGLTDLFHFNSVTREGYRLLPGLYGLSNGRLNEPWPKVRRGLTELSGLLTGEEEYDSDRLMQLMRCQQKAAPHELPDTGIGADKEHFLSSLFIAGATYGTRAITLVTLNQYNEVFFAETSFSAAAEVTDTREYCFTLSD